jgi:acetylornithine/N-succinyldiaminopimelate aminotransferase
MLLPLIIDQVAMSHTVKPHLDSHMLPVFARADVAFERGEGPWLIATNGDRYLDFTSGVAVNALGHAHPHLVAALQEQTAKLWHVSNLFTIPEGERLATRLCDEASPTWPSSAIPAQRRWRRPSRWRASFKP